jgi:hypothetical protein
VTLKSPGLRPGPVYLTVVVVFALSVVVAVVVVAPFFVCFVLVVPVLLIAIVMADANDFLLVVFAAEAVVISAVVVVVQVWLRVVDDYLMAVVEIVIMIAGRQFPGEDPVAFALVDKLVVGYIIIALDVRDVVVFYVIIARGAPGGLDTNVDGKLDLRLCRVGESDTAANRACQEQFFHTF